MTELEQLFAKYRRLVVFDTETTGLNPKNDQIIEFAAAVLEQQDHTVHCTREYDVLVQLPQGRTIPPKIVELTGITDQALQETGIARETLCRDLEEILGGPDTLLVAYNAHFDLCFLFYALSKYGNAHILRGKDKLDLLTVYRDRRPYPHRLASAISAYGLEGQVQNSHRAIDDVLATVQVMLAMGKERADLERYINLFGYNAKYGLEGKPISSVTYRPQGYRPAGPIYELL